MSGIVFCYVSTVCKEKVTEEREELTLKTFTYKLDEDDENGVSSALMNSG